MTLELVEPTIFLFFQPCLLREKASQRKVRQRKNLHPKVSELRSSSVWHGLIWGARGKIRALPPAISITLPVLDRGRPVRRGLVDSL